MFSQVCVRPQGGRAWGACMAGDVHGGGVYGRGVCMVRGHAWQGVAGIAGGMHGRKDGHCSSRYASYWNAFMFAFMFRDSCLYLT